MASALKLAKAAFGMMGKARILIGPAKAQVDAIQSRGPLLRALRRTVHSRALNNIVLSGATTYDMLVQTATDFARVMPELCVGNNSDGSATAPAFFVYVAAVPNATKAAADAATWVQVQMQSANLTPSSAIHKRMIHRPADFVKLPSVPRDDGGSGCLLLMRAYVATGTIVILGNGTDSFTNWANEDWGMFRWREQPGNYVTTNQAGFTTTTNTSRSPFCGLAYIPRYVAGKTITSIGDSNAVGYGETIGKNHMFLACKQISLQSGIPFEYADAAWGGHASPAIRDDAIDLFSSTGLFSPSLGFQPDVAHVPLATQNDWPVSPTVSTIVDAGAAPSVSDMEGNLAQVRALAARYNIPVIRSTWQASQARLWGTSDGVRRARNAKQRLLSAGSGEIWIDVASVIDDVPDGSGQAPMKSAFTKDTAHFNDAGHLAVSPYSAQAILAAVGVPPGKLFGQAA